MNKIEIKILNPSAIKESEQMMVCAARLTQKGHAIQSLQDFIDLYNKDYSETTVKNMIALPHPTIQKFGVVNVVIVGASRRFLAQITRHQNEVKFMSASLQYSDYSGKAGYTVPYDILGTEKEAGYLAQCEASMQKYMSLVTAGVNNDDAGYIAPHGLRNIILISATPYQWKHMIHQRICRRNTPETRYVMLLIWRALYRENKALFSDCGAFCMQGTCKEGKMGCGCPITLKTPDGILAEDFPKICG